VLLIIGTPNQPGAIHEDKVLAKIFTELREKTAFMKILGSYLIAIL
jgi:prephenate dehydratase